VHYSSQVKSTSVTYCCQEAGLVMTQSLDDE